MPQFTEDARKRSIKYMDSLREEFDGLSDDFLLREAERIEDIAKRAKSDAGRLRSEMRRRALVENSPVLKEREDG